MHPPTPSSTPAAAAHSGGVPIVFERLLGTDAAERDELPLTYGLVHSRTRYNRLDVELATVCPLARRAIEPGPPHAPVSCRLQMVVA